MRRVRLSPPTIARFMVLGGGLVAAGGLGLLLGVLFGLWIGVAAGLLVAGGESVVYGLLGIDVDRR